MLADERHNRRDRMRVVPAIDPDLFSVAVDAFQSSAPSCRRDSALNRLRRNSRQQRTQLLRRPYRQPRVAFLKIARKGSRMSGGHDMERISEHRRAMAEYAQH